MLLLCALTGLFFLHFFQGFTGGNGPIFSIVLGRKKFKHCLFIGGAFNNGPPIVLWTPSDFSMDRSTALRNITTDSGDDSQDCSRDGCVFPVGANVNIYGLITSISQVSYDAVCSDSYICELLCNILVNLLNLIYAVSEIICQLQIPVAVASPADAGPDDPSTPIVQSTSTLSMLFFFSISIGICLGKLGRWTIHPTPHHISFLLHPIINHMPCV